MISYLSDAFISSAPRIGKYINRMEFYRQYPPRRVKNIKITEIENTSRVRSVASFTPVIIFKRYDWNAYSILSRYKYGVYICTCLVRSNYYMYKTNMHFLIIGYFNPLHQSKCFGDHIGNRAGAPIFFWRIIIERQR